MLIEFDTVRMSRKEAWQREMQADLNGEASIPFENSEDYITQITVDMNNINDFTGGKIYINSKEMNCVYLNDNERLFDNVPILMDYKEFKKVFEYAKGVKIYRHEEL